MDLRKIESVCAVAAYRSYTEAAFRIASSPSVISKHIAAVEDELGVRLFRRATKSAPVELTEAGEKIVPHFDEILRRYALVEEAAGKGHSEKKEILRVGYVQQLGSYRENSILAGYTLEHPNTIILRKTFAFHDLAAQLLNDSVDAAFLPVIEGTVLPGSDYAKLFDGSFVVTEIMTINHLSLGVPRNHPLAKQQEIPASAFSALANETFLFPADEVGSDLLTSAVSRRFGLEGRMKIRYVDFSEKILPSEIAASENCLLPQLCLVPATMGMNAAIRLVPVEGGCCNITLYLIYRKSADHGALRKLNQYVLSSSAQYYADFPFITVPDRS